MKRILILAGLLLAQLSFGQALWRNAWSTNVPPAPVQGVNNLSVTNLGTGTNWQFFNVGPKTVARLGDVTNVANGTQVWTNDGLIIRPVGPTNSVVNIRRDGSVFYGSNTWHDFNFNSFGGTLFPMAVTSMVDSNDPPTIRITLNGIDSENYAYESFVDYLAFADKDTPRAALDLFATSTNGESMDVSMLAKPSEPTFSAIGIVHNGSSTFSVTGNGSMNVAQTATVGSYITNSALYPSRLVATGTGTQLVSSAYSEGNFVLSNNGVATNLTNFGSSYVLGTSASNVFNARYYGATGDGSTDDTTAIQAAFNAAGQSSATIIIPAGTYKITATLTNYGMKDVEIVGNGAGTSVGTFAAPSTIFAWYGATNGTMFKIDRSDGMRYRNLHFDCFRTNTPTVMMWIDQTGPSAWGTTTDLEFSRCSFRSQHTNLPSPFYAVQISTNSASNCENIRFTDCYWQGSGVDYQPCTNSSYGLWIGNNANAKKIIIKGGNAKNFTNFLYMGNGGISVSDTFLTGSCADFVVVANADPCIFEHNRSEFFRQAFIIKGGSEFEFRANTWSDNASISTGFGMCEIDATVYLNMLGNRFAQSATVTNFLVAAGQSPTLFAAGNQWSTNDLNTNGLSGFIGGYATFLNHGAIDAIIQNTPLEIKGNAAGSQSSKAALIANTNQFILTNGLVGIGVSAPTAKFEVDGTVNSYLVRVNTNTLVITNGNVGIGTNAPAYTLNVVGTGGLVVETPDGSGAKLRIAQSGMLSAGSIDMKVTSPYAGLFRSGGTTAWIYYDVTTGDSVLNNVFGGSSGLRFELAQSVKMKMDSGGNVFIGNSLSVTNTFTNRASIFAPTNTALFNTIAPANLHNIALGKGWTNDLGARADIVMSVKYTDAVAGDPSLAFTNTVTGEAWTNKFAFGIAGSMQELVTIPDISPSDFGSFTEISGTGASVTILNAWWKLK